MSTDHRSRDDDGGREAFSIDKSGKKVDAHIHDPILDDGDVQIQAEYVDRLRRRGYSAKTINTVTEMQKQRGPQHQRQSMASGGMASYFERQSFRDLHRAGMIHSPVPGRTDKIPMKVRGGSYVIPADVVSGIGQGNSTAGASILNRMFKQGPYGAGIGKIPTPSVNYGVSPRAPHMMRPHRMRGFEDGGMIDPAMSQSQEEPHSGTDIIAAGGEYLVPPDVVHRLGGGNMRNGHDILDHMVLTIRRQTINEMRKLAPPKKGNR